MRNSERNDPKKVVRKLVSERIKARPKRITLRLSWEDKKSSIRLLGDGLDEAVEHQGTIPFTPFAHGVIEAYEEVYGKLKVISVSFRENVYENDEVSLDLYPTGGAGKFDIFVRYKRRDEEARFREQGLGGSRTSKVRERAP